MTLFRRLSAIVFVVAWVCAPMPALAAVKDIVFNKEGVWAIDVDSGACALSRTLSDGSTFLFRAKGGGVTFGYFPKARVKIGRTGRFELGALGFDFRPSFVDDGETLYLNDQFDPEIVAALRSARDLRVLIDGRPVVVMTLADTGFADGLDGVVACSKGQEGWWGKGVPAAAADGPAQDQQPRRFVMNKENAWGIAVSEDPGICIAQARIDDHMDVQILSAGGLRGLAIASDRRMPGGKRGRVETDAASFDFTVSVDKDRRYLTMDDPFESVALTILQNAKWMRVSLERKVLLDIQVDDTGFAELLDAVAACSKGESGWWGKGAKPRS